MIINRPTQSSLSQNPSRPLLRTRISTPGLTTNSSRKAVRVRFRGRRVRGAEARAQRWWRSCISTMRLRIRGRRKDKHYKMECSLYYQKAAITKNYFYKNTTASINGRFLVTNKVIGTGGSVREIHQEYGQPHACLLLRYSELHPSSQPLPGWSMGAP
ncbi:unnamed protein product [Brassica oleracea]